MGERPLRPQREAVVDRIAGVIVIFESGEVRIEARRAAARWVICALAFVAWNLLPVLEEFRRVEVGFAGAAALLCGLLYLLYRRPQVRPEDVVEPGSPQEIEARLAAADEAS